MPGEDNPSWPNDMQAQFPDYDLSAIQSHIASHQPIRRFSQRAEADRVVRLIAVIAINNPDMSAPVIADVLRTNRTSDGETLGKTFERAVGAHVRAARSSKGKKREATRTTARAAQPGKSGSAVQTVAPAAAVAETAPAVAVAETAPAAHVAQPAFDMSPPTGQRARAAQRPYRFSGTFAGKVFTSGITLHRFYSAVQRRADMVDLFDLAGSVLADDAAMRALPRFHPDDRAIFDAVVDAMASD